jgi:hypothetical protein
VTVPQVCWNCNEEGHFAASCPLPLRKGTVPMRPKVHYVGPAKDSPVFVGHIVHHSSDHANSEHSWPRLPAAGVAPQTPTRYPCLIDTGASTSCVSAGFVRHQRLERFLRRITPIALTTGNGGAITSWGLNVTLKFPVLGDRHPVEVSTMLRVLPSRSYIPILLGGEHLRSLKGDLCYPTATLKLVGQVIPSTVLPSGLWETEVTIGPATAGGKVTDRVGRPVRQTGKQGNGVTPSEPRGDKLNTVSEEGWTLMTRRGRKAISGGIRISATPVL